MLRLALFFTLFATLAQAGAWPREKGRAFIANSIELSAFSFGRPMAETPYFSSFYLEYGLSQSLTLGLHTGHGSTADLDARAFARLPIGRSDTHKVAVEFSAGQVGTQGYIGLGLHYGRGIKAFDRFGWFSVETRVDLFTNSPDKALRQTKIDLTLGLTHRNGVKTMAQVFATETGGEVYATFAPMLVVPLWRKTKLETGMMFDLTQGQRPGLKIGVWQEF